MTLITTILVPAEVSKIIDLFDVDGKSLYSEPVTDFPEVFMTSDFVQYKRCRIVTEKKDYSNTRELMIVTIREAYRRI